MLELQDDVFPFKMMLGLEDDPSKMVPFFEGTNSFIRIPISLPEALRDLEDSPLASRRSWNLKMGVVKPTAGESCHFSAPHL